MRRWAGEQRRSRVREAGCARPGAVRLQRCGSNGGGERAAETTSASPGRRVLPQERAEATRARRRTGTSADLRLGSTAGRAGRLLQHRNSTTSPRVRFLAAETRTAAVLTGSQREAAVRDADEGAAAQVMGSRG